MSGTVRKRQANQSLRRKPGKTCLGEVRIKVTSPFNDLWYLKEKSG